MNGGGGDCTEALDDVMGSSGLWYGGPSQHHRGPWATLGGGLSSLTQVPSHQVGVVEVFHSKAHNVDEVLDDLHEVHRARVDLGEEDGEDQPTVH